MQWLKLLGVVDSMGVLPELQAAGVVVVPGRITSPLAGDPHFACPWVRLSFSHAPEARLREGVRRLAGALRRRREREREQRVPSGALSEVAPWPLAEGVEATLRPYGNAPAEAPAGVGAAPDTHAPAPPPLAAAEPGEKGLGIN